MDDRVERLLNKAEAAIERNDLDQGEAFRYLASQVSYLRRREAKDLDRMYSLVDTVDTDVNQTRPTDD